MLRRAPPFRGLHRSTARWCKFDLPMPPAPTPNLPTLDELSAFFASDFPQSTVTLVALGDGTARVRQAVDDRHLRPGGTVSGPVMMATADAAAYAALLSKIGIVPLTVTANLSISFLRKPKPDRAVIGDARVLKAGRTLAFLEVWLTSEGDTDPIAHCTLTYAIPSALPPAAKT
jgi:uncharacterized protein (TIGR00369 family)